MNVTKEEFIEMFGTCSVKFDSYYKYEFCYLGQLENGRPIVVSYGGIASDIYKFRVSADEWITVKELDPSFGIVGVGDDSVFFDDY